MMICNNLRINYANSLKQVIFSLERNHFLKNKQYHIFHSGFVTSEKLREHSPVITNTLNISETRNNFYARFYSVSKTVDKSKNVTTKPIENREIKLDEKSESVQDGNIKNVTNKTMETLKEVKLDETEIIKTDAPLSRKEKLKKAVKEYGTTVIVFHVGISLISLGSCYILVSTGMDTSAIFKVLGVDKFTNDSQIAGNAGTFAIAYAIHKIFAPVRIGITLGSVPFIVRYLRKVGFLKHK